MPRKKILLDESAVKQMETMAAFGLNIEQMAAILGFTKPTFERRIAENPAVFEAIEKGRATALLNVGKTAYDLAVSGSEPAMTMFYLKCRGRWKETQAIEHSGADGKPLESTQVTVYLPDNGRKNKD